MGATAYPPDSHGPETDAEGKSGWAAVRAAILIGLGILAIAEPGVAGLAVTVLAGWLLIFGGLAHGFGAFRGGGAVHVLWQVLLGIIYFVGGVYFVTHPLLGLGTLTLLLAGILLAEAIVTIVAYVQRRHVEGSAWLLFNGLITVVLSGLIWIHWPSSSVWAIGTLLGINLLMSGISRLMVGVGARRLVS
jgi:uncharacterized membrane protein HdeD (DUF308 family)